MDRAKVEGVMEIVGDFAGDTLRGAYTVKFREAIYVLHCFRQNVAARIKTAKVDVELVTQQLETARDDYETRHGKANR